MRSLRLRKQRPRCTWNLYCPFALFSFVFFVAEKTNLLLLRWGHIITRKCCLHWNGSSFGFEKSTVFLFERLLPLYVVDCISTFTSVKMFLLSTLSSQPKKQSASFWGIDKIFAKKGKNRQPHGNRRPAKKSLERVQEKKKEEKSNCNIFKLMQESRSPFFSIISRKSTLERGSSQSLKPQQRSTKDR